jgi:hypothetical protein
MNNSNDNMTVTLTWGEWLSIRIALLECEATYLNDGYEVLAESARDLFHKVRDITDAMAQDLDKAKV